MPDTAAKKKKTKNKTKINNEPQPYCQIRLTGKATGDKDGDELRGWEWWGRGRRACKGQSQGYYWVKTK